MSKYHLAAILGGLTFLLGFAQTPVTENKKPGAPASVASYESVANDPLNARIYTLKNGLKVYLSVYKNAPRIQTYMYSSFAAKAFLTSSEIEKKIRRRLLSGVARFVVTT